MLSTVKKERRPSTAYVGRAGDDDDGRKLAALAVDAGLRATYEIDKERRPTGRLATLVNRGTGSRTMVADLGASTHYDPDHLEEHIPSRLLEESSIIVTDGFFFDA
jgi:sugar/nucleoside kinase (ribokinase family)